MRAIRRVYQAPAKHWVGDGFYVSPLFSHMGEDKQTSPFLMLDYAMPQTFDKNQQHPRGVGSHPHAGFETVTLALQGEIAHRDSTGAGGIIAAGDVQWMTAGRGIVHEEFHSEAFSERGGVLEMLQLWVNLPKKHKNVAPSYQNLAAANIPVVQQDDAQIRVIAGQLGETQGAAHTYSELNVWEIDLPAQGKAEIRVPDSHNLLLVALRGDVVLNEERTIRPTELVSFVQEAGEIVLQTGDDAAKLVLLSGVPIDEPIVGYGPFVMNTQAEIIEKINDFNAGRLGDLH
ncbi:MAG: pirin family protein [Neisseria sp.]|nr:pirin family protein [Neisseria sp.]